jgi:hypothetical protein
MGTLVELTDQRFGRLRVIELAFIRGRAAYWTCICDCGIYKVIRSGNLRSGATTSCGCHHSDILAARKYLAEGETARNSTFYNIQRNASRRKLAFTLTFDEWFALSQQNCTYCNATLSNTCKLATGDIFKYNGLDRVDNTRGYTIDNVVSCCKICNIAKSTMTADEYIAHCRKVAAYNE